LSKVQQRASRKSYTDIDHIYADIVDLAGVRVALYFPGEREQLDTVVKELFAVVGDPKTFPEKASGATTVKTDAPYTKRFSGYWATHYRVQMRDNALGEAQKRYAEARIEIQVASVVMHAWAEVEHDLVYKPLQGALSDDEYAILDELNGLVIAGEIALERLQRAAESRVAAADRPFANHFDLAAHLLARTSSLLRSPQGDTALGRVDQLFELLKQLNLATPGAIQRYVQALHGDTERRPISEQITDQLLAEDEARYAVYESVRQTHSATLVPEQHPREADLHEAIGYFLKEWIALEKRLRTLVGGNARFVIPTGKLLAQVELLDEQARLEIERIRRVRNNLVHGVEMPNPADIREDANRLRKLVTMLRKRPKKDQQAKQ
jgi:ppGpp synthetase/RelA/SpoT-type nucleotidyltranferase